jgi:hypothetical protein
LKKQKGQSRMDNPEKLATLGAQDTRRNLAQNTLQRQTTKHKPQHRKIWATNQSGKYRNPCSRKSKQFLFLIKYMHVTHIVITCWSPLCVNKLKNTVSYETLTTLRMISSRTNSPPVKVSSEWVIDFRHLSNFSAISWREQVNFQWNERYRPSDSSKNVDIKFSSHSSFLE